MRTFCGAALALAGLAILSQPAAAQCPSGYFQANASQPVGNFGATMNATVCVLVSTVPTEISLKSAVTVEVLNVAKLQQAIVERFAGSGCAFDSITGWDVTGADVKFFGTTAAAGVRVDVVGRDCQRFKATKVTYQAPLIIDRTNNILTARVDGANARVSSGNLLVKVAAGAIAGKISEQLNSALAHPIDLNTYIPPYLRSLGPEASDVSIALQSRKLTLKVSVNGRLTKPAADKLLDDTVRNQIMPPLLRWVGSTGV